MKKMISMGVLLLAGLLVSGQEKATRDAIYRENIRTVRLHRSEWNLSYPVIALGTDDRLALGFDLLGEDIETFYYSFEHCNKDWEPSGLNPAEFIDGYADNQVEDYSLSFNTTVNYIHYSLEFPNRYVKFRLSGNYIIKVYPLGEPGEPVFVRRFMISENSVTIEAMPQRPKITSMYNSHQQIDFTVKHPGLTIRDPSRSVFSSILQNGMWEISRNGLKPDFIRSDELLYNDLSGKNLFPGISEYRYFDIKSIRYQSEYIKSIAFVDNRYQVLLAPSENRSARQYFYWKDLNGQYYTAIQEGRDHDTESDYLMVFFTLPSENPIPAGDVYIFGELTGWELKGDNRMVYNQSERAYEGSLLLKQGWYNYLYAVSGREEGEPDFDPFENNHFETENDYLILVYLREPMGRYDRLIGSKVINTVNRLDQ